MKMNTNIHKAPKGVTLIELSVVIAVILVLISVLFVGASYYRTSASRAACIVSQSNIEKAVESYANISQANLLYADLDTSGPMAGQGLPTCPSTGGAYTIAWGTSGDATVSCDGDATHVK
ncbi:type II secretion system protein [Rubritalea spongiae]|uniref:Type II secretion system protein n=1 Tax=Rubritalea spongiae TaxID=430797 RepID=A0ABW5E7L9_9BACT